MRELTACRRMRSPGEIDIGFVVDRLPGKRYATRAPLSDFQSPSCLSPRLPKMAKSQFPPKLVRCDLTTGTQLEFIDEVGTIRLAT